MREKDEGVCFSKSKNKDLLIGSFFIDGMIYGKLAFRLAKEHTY